VFACSSDRIHSLPLRAGAGAPCRSTEILPSSDLLCLDLNRRRVANPSFLFSPCIARKPSIFAQKALQSRSRLYFRLRRRAERLPINSEDAQDLGLFRVRHARFAHDDDSPVRQGQARRDQGVGPQDATDRLPFSFAGPRSCVGFIQVLLYFHVSPFRSSLEGRSGVPPLVERKSGGTPLPL